MNRNFTTHVPPSPPRPRPPHLDAFLQRLGTDDAYRSKFLADPVEALAEYDIHVDPAQVPAIRALPSKRELLEDRTRLDWDWMFFFVPPPPSGTEKSNG